MDKVIDPENTHRTEQAVFEDGQEWEIVEGGTTKNQLLNEAVRKMIESFVSGAIGKFKGLEIDNRAVFNARLKNQVAWFRPYVNSESL